MEGFGELCVGVGQMSSHLDGTPTLQKEKHQ